MSKKQPIIMPSGIAAKYEYKGNDGGNPLLPTESGHYWMNGYAIWRPPKCQCPHNATKAKKVRGIWVWVIED